MEQIETHDRLAEVLKGQEENYLYPFFWLHGAEPKILEEYVEKIRESGCGAFCVESRPHPDFLGPGWWRDLDILLAKAEELGMKVWILDDSHFPTGYANGRVKNAPDSLKQWYLRHQEMEFAGPINKGRISVFCGEHKDGGFVGKEEALIAAVLFKRKNGEEFTVEESVDVTSRIKNGWLSLTLPEGKYRLCVITKCRGRQKAFQDYIDMTNPESVKLLLEETYETHYRRYPEKFGKVIAGFFSDEPGFYNSEDESGYSFRYQIGADMLLPWNPYIEEEFQKELKAQALLPKEETNFGELLPALWLPAGERKEEIRAAYMNVLTRLYQRNFTGQLSSWCQEHGVLYVGYVIEDNNCHARLGCGPGHYFRAMAGQDASGVDVVLQQILPGKDYLQYGLSSRGPQDGSFNFYGLAKLGSSMAHLDPKMQGKAMCEIFGAYGWAEGISLMVWLANHMLVRGINLFVPHAFSENTFPDTDCPPHFYGHGQNPQYPYMKILFRYMNRMCHLLSGGLSLVRIGVLYHAEAEWLGRSMYFHTLGEVLSKSQVDYDVIPLDILKTAEIQNGVIKAGSLTLSCLLIPFAEAYPKELSPLLLKCREAGVKVYQVTGNLPENSREKDLWSPIREPKGERLNACEAIPLEGLADKMRAEGLTEIGFADASKGEQKKWLRYYHYLAEDKGRQIFLFFHEGQNGILEGRVSLPCTENLSVYDAFQNRLFKAKKEEDGTFSLKLHPGELLTLVSGIPHPERLPKRMAVPEESLEPFDGEFVISAADAGRPDIFTVIGKRKAEELSTFDIEEELPGFSGILRYEAEIDGKNRKPVILDLGEVGQGAEVWINGKNAGTAICPPYRYDLSKLSVAGKNQLCIEVRTTPALALRDGFSKHMVFLPEGMMGPVRFGFSEEKIPEKG